MARFLIVVPPLTGHTNPTVSVGAELRRRGHVVAWCGYADVLAPLLPADAPIEAIASDIPAAVGDAVRDRSTGLRGAGALKFLWEEFLIPLADAMVDGVDAAAERFAPDVMVVDQQTLAGALVARRRGLPWATSATTSAELVDPFAALPKLRDWLDELVDAFIARHDAGGRCGPASALRTSGQLVLAFTSHALVGDSHRFGPEVAFVGPAFGGRPSTDDFPWAWLDDEDDPARRPLVLVSLGTVNADAGTRFFTEIVGACEGQAWQAVLVAPSEFLAQLTEVPANVLVRQRVPQVALLDRCAAVVSHGGHNTVCETLAHALPLVVAPIRDDQPVVADQVVAAGAGIRVKFARAKAPLLQAAIHTVLTEPSYRVAAARVAASFDAAGGAPMAADRLEALASRAHPTAR